jgi:hypothetical protein
MAQWLTAKTVEAHARGVRRRAARSNDRIDAMSAEQATDYFPELLQSHSWALVTLNLYG